MNVILLTQNDGKILGPIAKLLGFIINVIFNVLAKLGVPNVGLSIIIFTFIIYFCLLPLTFKQQKFSKLSAVMQPEIRAIQEKYKGKTDQDTTIKMNEEMQAVYKKYGVSPTGSCVQLLIQMPILFALYRVIYNIPAYVVTVKNSLEPLANAILEQPGGSDFIKELNSAKMFAKSDFTLANTIIDVLNRATNAEWTQISEKFPAVSSILDTAHSQFLTYYSFGAINIADSPQTLLNTGWADKNVIMMVGALLVPLFAALTQWLNVLFMPQAGGNNNDPNDTMASSMKTMNIMMPMMSAVFCFTLPAGLGLYWIASAVVRSIQQVCINKYFDKKGIDTIIAENVERAKKKEAKQQEIIEKTSKSSLSSAKNFSNIKNIPSVENSSEIKKGSLAEKAAMVKRFNDNK